MAYLFFCLKIVKLILDGGVDNDIKKQTWNIHHKQKAPKKNKEKQKAQKAHKSVCKKSKACNINGYR